MKDPGSVAPGSFCAFSQGEPRLGEPYEAVPQTPPASPGGAPVAGTEEEPDVMGERSEQDREQHRMKHAENRVGGRK